MSRAARIIGVPMDLGQAQRGVDMGPSAVRYAGLSSRLRELGYDIQDAGNVSVAVRDTLKKEDLIPAIGRACREVYAAGRRALEDKCIPIFLGGDHSIAIGTVGGVTHDSPSGVIWADAHGDYNTPETSVSSSIHGMALAVLTGRGPRELIDVGREGAKLKPQDVVLVGVRQLDKEERILLKQSGMAVYTMRDIDEQGISDIARRTVKHLSHLSRIHLSLDMDIMDPGEAPGVGTPVSGGLNYREAQLLMEIIADSRALGSMDIVEINPIMDERNRTARIAIELAVSALGKTIL